MSDPRGVLGDAAVEPHESLPGGFDDGFRSALADGLAVLPGEGPERHLEPAGDLRLDVDLGKNGWRQTRPRRGERLDARYRDQHERWRRTPGPGGKCSPSRSVEEVLERHSVEVVKIDDVVFDDVGFIHAR